MRDTDTLNQRFIDNIKQVCKLDHSDDPGILFCAFLEINPDLVGRRAVNIFILRTMPHLYQFAIEGNRPFHVLTAKAILEELAYNGIDSFHVKEDENGYSIDVFGESVSMTKDEPVIFFHSFGLYVVVKQEYTAASVAEYIRFACDQYKKAFSILLPIVVEKTRVSGIGMINKISCEAVLKEQLTGSGVNFDVIPYEGLVNVIYSVPGRFYTVVKVVDSDYMLEIIKEDAKQIRQFHEYVWPLGHRNPQFINAFWKLPGNFHFDEGLKPEEICYDITRIVLSEAFGASVIRGTMGIQPTRLYVPTRGGNFFVVYSEFRESLSWIIKQLKKHI